jgi:hypothetical protein
MEQPKQAQEPERARAAFNMVALHLAGYTYDRGTGMIAVYGFERKKQRTSRAH